MKEVLDCQPLVAESSEIGAALWRFEDVRAETLKWLATIDPTFLDATLPGLNSVGSLLYHIALVEIDWLYTEVLMTEFTDEIEALFPFPSRDALRNLTHIEGMTLDEHLSRFKTVRDHCLKTYQVMTMEDYQRLRELESYDVSPEWVLHHLIQHESMHLGEMMTTYTVIKRNLG